jgi:hypothetical protein
MGHATAVAASYVTKTALLRRINRKLATEGWLKLRKSRGDRQRSQLGDFYIFDVVANALVEADVDLPSKARELGVLASPN